MHLMKRFGFVGLILAGGLAQGASYRVVPSFPQGAILGKSSVLRFSVFQGASTTPLTAKDLKIEHEKPIHLMTVDAGFLEYLHEHPVEVSPGIWEVPLLLKTAGNYRFWLQLLPASETNTKTLSFDQAFLAQPGQTVPTQPVDSSEKLVATSGDYEVTLSFPNGDPVQHEMVGLRFTVEKNGTVIPFDKLENYLGAKFHVAGISANRKDFAHAHPGEHPGSMPMDPDVIGAHFMQDGYYGLYVQFQDAGKVQTVRFGINVAEAF